MMAEAAVHFRKTFSELPPNHNLSLDITSLLDACIGEIIKHIPYYLEAIQILPINIKDKLLNIMSKRGLISDENIGKIIHKKVQYLDLSSCDIGNEGLSHLKICINLRVLDFNAGKNDRITVTAEGLEDVFIHCNYLKTVFLRRCIGITDKAITTLAQHCPHVTELNIGGCPLITDVSLEALGQNTAKLQSFQFSKTQVTDIGIYKLVSGLCQNNLMEIVMDGCINLTDDAVETVVTCCPNISILIFHNCPNITDHSRQIIGSRNLKVKQLTWTVY